MKPQPHAGLIGCMSVVLALVLATTASAKPAHHGALSSFLDQLATVGERHGTEDARSLAAARGLLLRGTREQPLFPVILVPRPGLAAAAIDRLEVERRGGRVDAVSRSFMRVLMPARRLREIAGHPDVESAREPIAAHPLAGYGPNVSESVGLTGAEVIQTMGTTGAGVKVAVVDLGFVGLTAAQSADELPANVIRVDFTGLGLETSTNHGTGVMEHVLDMAPAVTPYGIKVGDEVDLQNAADYIASNGIRIANHSVGWVNASFYDDTGPISAILNESRDVDGVFWTVAAGDNARSHWRGGWNDPDANNRLNFTATDEFMELTTASGSPSIFLNWNQYGNSVTDLDLYVYNRNNQIVARSTGPQTGPQDPSESVSFLYYSIQAPYRIQIFLYAGPTAGLDMTVFSFYNDLEYPVAASSLMDPACAHGAFSVAAIDQSVFGQPNPPAEPFSSQGPTTDGRLKPDITAPDGTTSWTYGPQGAFGTSFSSPTAAGAAALLLEQGAAVTASELQATLSASAMDIGPPGPDPVFGAGKLNLPPGVQVGVESAPAGLTVQVDGISHLAPKSLSWTPGSSHTIDVSSPQSTGTGETRYVFGSWSDGGAQSHGVVAPPAPTTYTATFGTEHLLQTFVSPPEGGSVGAAPSSADGYYASGSSVQLTATPATNYQFTMWTNDLTGSDNPQSLTMDAPRSVTGNFASVIAVDPPGVEVGPLELGAISPNPFSGFATVSYRLPRAGEIELAAFDLEGRRVYTLAAGLQSEGRHRVTWSGRDERGGALAAGVYYLVLQHGGERSARRVCLLK